MPDNTAKLPAPENPKTRKADYVALVEAKLIEQADEILRLKRILLAQGRGNS